MLADPGPYQPRKQVKRQKALLREFQRRRGDPNTGGQTRARIVTAYRQDARRIAVALAQEGIGRPAELSRTLGIPNAAAILQKNHYGWFERVARGVYALSRDGKSAIGEG